MGHELPCLIKWQKTGDPDKIDENCRGQVSPGQAATLGVEPNERLSLVSTVSESTERLTITTDWGGSDVVTKLISPEGRTIDRHTDAPDVEHTKGEASEKYVVTDPEPGVWTIELFGADVPAAGEETTVQAETVLKPLAKAGGPYATTEGSPVTLEGSDSTDPDGSIQAFEWDLDDDGDYDDAKGSSPTHRYPDDGKFNVGLRVTDAQGATATDTTTVTVANVAPKITKLSGDEIAEGETATLSGEFTDPGPADTHTVTVDRDDGTSETVEVDTGERSFRLSHLYRDDNPSATPSDDHAIRVTVADDDGGSGSEETTVTVRNVAPEIADATGDQIAEGETASLKARFVDEGLEDTHKATVDWGDGTSEPVDIEPVVGIPEVKVGVIEASHVYGDDGDYTVTGTVEDDDTGADTATTTVSVDNLDPTVDLDTSDTVAFPGGDAFVGQQGTEQSHRADGDDPSSDDLTFAWSFGVSTTYFNETGDPSGSPDPDQSPHGTFPFTAADTASFTPSKPGVVDLAVDLRDDDGGSHRASAPKLVVGARSCTRSQGFWKQQVRDQGPQHVDEDTVAAYLDVSNAGSSVFSELTTASTREEAEDVLWPQGLSIRDKAEAQLLAAWLNFSSGAVGWNEDVDGTAVGERLAEAEAILHNGDASHGKLEQAKDLAEAINLHDEDNPDCAENGGAEDGDEQARGRSGDNQGNGNGNGQS